MLRSGIDQTTSSILLGTVTCFGTEDRPGNIITNQMVGTIVPIMQFANSEIADLQIVDDEYLAKELAKKQNQRSVPVTPVAPTFVQPSIHDDPAIVSAVVNSASKQESSSINSNLSTQMMTAFNQMTLNDGNSKVEGKNREKKFIFLNEDREKLDRISMHNEILRSLFIRFVSTVVAITYESYDYSSFHSNFKCKRVIVLIYCSHVIYSILP